MNILFISISSLPHVSEHGISLDLIHEFRKHGHNMFIICALDKKDKQGTYITEEDGCKILRVKIGNNKKANLIEKGITTLLLPQKYIAAIKKYYNDIKFDLVLYPTPPVTQAETVKFIKNRDGAKTYLLLKDIFPQNAVDLGMMNCTGYKSIIYRYFRKKEKKLYAVSDYIGCMSQANVDYVLKHNPEVKKRDDDSKKENGKGIVEICPNSIEVTDKSVDEEARTKIRKKYGIPLDKKVFVYGGNLGKPQGIPFLIKCLEKAKDVEEAFFLIVGDGTEYGLLEDYVIKANQQNLKLMKRLPKEDYDTMVSACDVGMIFLDHRFTIPNFPSRLLSYMQAKLPVLAVTDPNTDIGKVIVEGGFGWWCVSYDVNRVLKTIDNILINDLQKFAVNSFSYLQKNYNVKFTCIDILNTLNL